MRKITIAVVAVVLFVSGLVVASILARGQGGFAGVCTMRMRRKRIALDVSRRSR